MKPFIETFTGCTFDSMRPERQTWSTIRIRDIAHSLANQGRFTGHARFRYSVAEHSVRVSELVASLGYPEHVQLWGLMHDASEAYLTDLATPLKLSRAFHKPYHRAEARLMRVICARFNLPWKEPEIVRWADATMLATEVRDLMHGKRSYWKKLTAKPIPGRIRPWSSDVAEFEFLRLFRLLGGS